MTMAKVHVRVIHDLYAILRQFPSPCTSPSYLSAHKFFIPKPLFQLFEKDGFHGCALTLPPNAAFQKIVVPLTCSSNLAKQLVGLDACKKLHELGALSDHLLPFHKDSQEIKIAGSNESTTGAGTTKRKELHGMERVRALHGTWALEPDGITLNAYRIHFVCDQGQESYSDFVLLLNSSLDADIAREEIKLFLTPNKIVTSIISPCGKINLSAEKVEQSKLFQEFFFNGMFGRLFTWNSSKMCLLLPWSIEWKVIYESVSVTKYLKKKHSVDEEPVNATTSSPVACETACVNSQIIKLANKSLHVRNLKDSVVFSIHNGRIYSVLDVINDVASDDPFDQMHATKHTQPLLLLKQSNKPDNLLSRSRFEGDSGGKKMVEKEQVHAHMPPELLVHISVSTDILKSFYLLPSIMHRLESLTLACRLRDEIAFNQIRIPISLILEAITTPRCCESFSSERLELLGDSVLKYALSCHLFLKYPTKREGYLSDCRSQAIRNSTLHRLGTSRSLQSYIRDNAFDPLRCLAPGQISIHPLPCVCGVDTYDKTIADCVGALVGAYYAGGGLTAALLVIRWLGIDITIDKVLIEKAKTSASDSILPSKVNKIKLLESELSYVFSSKRLLLEAITHQDLGLGYCYERLEFLGDAVLDLLTTRHHFLSHKDVDPGVLTHLCLASVTNENFAKIATRNNFHKYLQNGSRILSEKIKEYVTAIANQQCSEDMLLPNGLPKAPKVLGDIVESIAGAILIDTNFNPDAVGKIFEPLLSPIITPDNLELPSLRQLIELCSSLGYFIHTKCISKGEEFVAQLTVRLKDDLLLGSGCAKNMMIAKSQAALCLLKQLKAKGLYRDRCTPKKYKGPSISTANSLQLTANLRSSGYRSPLEENNYPKTNSKSTKAELDQCTPKRNKGPSISTANSLPLTANLRSSGYRSPLEENNYPKTNSKSTKAELDQCTPKRNKGPSISTAKSLPLTANLRSSGYRSLLEENSYLKTNCKSTKAKLDQCKPKRNKEPSISTAKSLPLTANLSSSGHRSPLEENSYPKTNRKSTKAKLDNPDLPITVPIRMEKGGPRTALFNLCMKLGCPMPQFELKEGKFRTPIILNGVQTPNLNLFRAIVSLHIPNFKGITVQGEERTNKKTAQDSAAREVLLELEKQEICILKESSPRC